ncbi:hypothetical protein I4674_04925 [Proteus mirabilis]|nr:hypothetical protein [Proteus mirabilis]
MMRRSVNYITVVLILMLLFLFQVKSKVNNRNINNRFFIFISLNNFTENSKLTKLISDLDNNIKKSNNQFDKIIYGYASVFLSEFYHNSKYYSQAARAIKQAFFYLDEAVEENPDNWRLTYLRLRMDAFTPHDLGRCVIAKKDSQQLFENNNINADLIPMIKYMYIRSLWGCHQFSQAESAIAQLLKESEARKIMTKYGLTGIPPWLPIEKIAVIQPLTLESN